MRKSPVEEIVERLEAAVREGRLEELETHDVEIKPVPPSGGEWKEIYRSACAFLNTRGGWIVIGVKHDQKAGRFVHTGFVESVEGKIKEIAAQFKDRAGNPLDVADRFSDSRVERFLEGRVAVIRVDELPADAKFAFFERFAYKRVLTGDEKFSEREIAEQEDYREEARRSRELAPIPDTTLEDIDLETLNAYIQEIRSQSQRRGQNQNRLETLKPSLDDARSFLERKWFLREGAVTVLGMLVCGRYPEDRLGAKCRVQCHVDSPSKLAADSQDQTGNILPVMDATLAYVMKNIHVGIVVSGGGRPDPEYPEELLRETINNALAHRDYSIDRQAFVRIDPRRHLVIRNPGSIPPKLLVSHASKGPADEIPPVRGIVPDAKARNPKLAEVLRSHRKWEGAGIGMATLVNLCLEERIDLPEYVLHKEVEEVELRLRPGPLLDERTNAWFESFDGYVAGKTGSRDLTDEERRVLAYLMKCEEAARAGRFTVLLSRDNNHSGALRELERAGLVLPHPISTETRAIYRVDPVLVRTEYRAELEAIFGESNWRMLDVEYQRILTYVYRMECFSKAGVATAKRVAFALHHERPASGPNDIRAFDRLYRAVRRRFNVLSGRTSPKTRDRTQSKKPVYLVPRNPSRPGEGYRLNRRAACDSDMFDGPGM